MARSRKAPVVAEPAESTPSSVQHHPDSTRDKLLEFSFVVNPLTAYRREANFFVRRKMLMEYAMRCTATSAAADSIADELGSQEIYVTPTESNPSATTVLLAQRAIDVINRSMGVSDGIQNFIHLFVESYWFSKTGVFILTPKKGGYVEKITVLDPMRPHPYYEWEDSLYGARMEGISDRKPNITPKYDSEGNLINQALGIWYADGSPVGENYFTVPYGGYHQITPGATGYGAFLDTIPRSEKQLPNILAHIYVLENFLDTLLCTDESQAILWQNVNPATLLNYSNHRKEIRRKRRAGQPIDIDDEGLRLHVTAQEADKPASVNAVNFRALPEGYDPLRILADLEQVIALGLGISPRRIAPDTQKERFGNAQQAAMLNGDEPGLRALRRAITQFFSTVVLEGLPIRAEFMSLNSPENYSVVAKDQAAAQVVAQVGDAMTIEQKQAYLLRQGVLLPADVGVPSMRTGDGGVDKMKSLIPQRTNGFVSLRWSDGTLCKVEKPIMLSGKKAFDVEECTLEATRRYEDWVVKELPNVVDTNGISHRALEEEVDDVSQSIYNTMIYCAKSQLDNIRGLLSQSVIDALRSGWFNAMGSPPMREALEVSPLKNLFDALWGVQGKITLGTATVAELQKVAAKFTSYIPRYMNALTALANIDDFEDMDSPVTWVRTALESCGDCVRFAGTYGSFAEMIRVTGGLVPGDIRLTCSGNCKCHLVGG